jgi:large subunit ribosomal protein L28
MSRVCEITGKRFMVGNKVSHSNRKTLRKFNVNLQLKKFYIPEEDAWIWLRVSMDGLRNINKKGISACLRDAEKNGIIKLY